MMMTDRSVEKGLTVREETPRAERVLAEQRTKTFLRGLLLATKHLTSGQLLLGQSVLICAHREERSSAWV